MPKKKHFWQLIHQMAEERPAHAMSEAWSSDAATIAAYVSNNGHIMTVDDVMLELRNYVPARSKWRVEHLGGKEFRFFPRRRSSAA